MSLQDRTFPAPPCMENALFESLETQGLEEQIHTTFWFFLSVFSPSWLIKVGGLVTLLDVYVSFMWLVDWLWLLKGSPDIGGLSEEDTNAIFLALFAFCEPLLPLICFSCWKGDIECFALSPKNLFDSCQCIPAMPSKSQDVKHPRCTIFPNVLCCSVSPIRTGETRNAKWTRPPKGRSPENKSQPMMAESQITMREHAARVSLEKATFWHHLHSVEWQTSHLGF